MEGTGLEDFKSKIDELMEEYFGIDHNFWIDDWDDNNYLILDSPEEYVEIFEEKYGLTHIDELS